MANFKNRSVSAHQFSMIPRADIPRSSFQMQKALKTAFNAGDLVPIFCEEVLPGDTFNVRMTAFCRLATPVFPVLDNLHLETFFFFVPNRLVWENWQRFMGERDPDPDSSIDYLVPVNTNVGGYPIGGLQDYFGLPTVGQVDPAGTFDHNVLPLRGYNLIFNEWFRDQNLQDSLIVSRGDIDDPLTGYSVMKRGKRHDYFTSALPWPQKGEAVEFPIAGNAPVITGTEHTTGAGAAMLMRNTAGGLPGAAQTLNLSAAGNAFYSGTAAGVFVADVQPTNLYADLSDITAITINQLRQAFQVQKLLERDARGGSRYTEIIFAHFGVKSPDARLQRPEYLGGGHAPVNINPVAQTADSLTTPLGNLAAFGTAVANGHGFTQSFTEHGYVIGIANVRADLTYQQGLRRHWSRQTRYDFYFPAFAMLGEQAILSKEIFCDGTASDEDVFGYQERWAEYRYNPSEVTGLMRSTAAGTIDAWHYAARFASRPLLNAAFIADSSEEVVERTTAVSEEANGQQLIMDAFFNIRAARPLPLYSVPGLIDHF